MKTKKLLILLISIITFFSCSDDDDNSPSVKSEIITLGSEIDNDIYYSLAGGVVKQVERKDWDIAFSVASRSASIIINEGSGISLKEYPVSDSWKWEDAIDTTGYSTWDELYNSDDNWEQGAFLQNAKGHPDYGWGEYNMATHNVTGKSLYIIKLANGKYKKIFIEAKKAIEKKYILKYADLSGSNEVTENISFTGLKQNYVYYSLVNGKIIADREPGAEKWDLLFTKYIVNQIAYPVVGVIQNMGIQAIDMDEVTNINIIEFDDAKFSENITTIGYDWKTFNHDKMAYEIDVDRIFFIKSKNDKTYKIIFTSYDNTKGEIKFDITKL